MAQKVEDLDVYRKAMEFWEAVNAIAERSEVRRNFKLHDQIADANDSIPSNIAEGFEQSSDAGFIKYLYHAKGSVGEVRVRLREAALKKLITPAELTERLDLGDSLSRMIAKLIQYLAECDWKDRGRFRSTQERPTGTRTQKPGPRDPGTKDPGPGDPGPGIRDQGPGTRDPGPGTRTRDQGPGTRDPGPGTRDQGPGPRDPGPETRDPRPGTRDPRPGTRDQGPATRDQGPGTLDQ